MLIYGEFSLGIEVKDVYPDGTSDYNSDKCLCMFAVSPLGQPFAKAEKQIALRARV